MNGCVFCGLYKDNSKVLYQGSECFAVLDKHPIEEGHLLIISKEHYTDMLSAPDNIVASMYIVAKRFAAKQKNMLGAAGVNIGSNIGKEAGQIIMHFHIHVIPRFSGKGRSFDFNHSLELSPEKEHELIEKLRE